MVIRNTVTISEPDGVYTYKTVLHNLSGPAIRYKNGSEWWYKDGVLHRDGGPAVTQYHKGTRGVFWYKDGKYHREGGPAVILQNGKIQEWYLDGVRQK
jgi:hypothetical protein